LFFTKKASSDSLTRLFGWNAHQNGGSGSFFC